MNEKEKEQRIKSIIKRINEIGKNIILNEYPITSLDGDVMIVVKDYIKPNARDILDNARYDYLIATNYWAHMDIIAYKYYLRKVVIDYLDGKADRDKLEYAINIYK